MIENMRAQEQLAALDAAENDEAEENLATE
jgi:hypothetical protein